MDFDMDTLLNFAAYAVFIFIFMKMNKISFGSLVDGVFTVLKYAFILFGFICLVKSNNILFLIR